jgi:hypothetical protein
MLLCGAPVLLALQEARGRVRLDFVDISAKALATGAQAIRLREFKGVTLRWGGAEMGLK